MTIVTEMFAPTLLVACPSRLELFTLVLEVLPRLRALLMPFRTGAAFVVAAFHIHHFLLHNFVEMRHMVIVVFFILVAPPGTMTRLVILCHSNTAMQTVLELVIEVYEDFAHEADRAFTKAPPREQLHQAEQGEQSSHQFNTCHCA